MSGVLEQSLTHDYWLSNVSPVSPESLLLSSKINEKKVRWFSWKWCQSVIGNETISHISLETSICVIFTVRGWIRW